MIMLHKILEQLRRKDLLNENEIAVPFLIADGEKLGGDFFVVVAPVDL